MGLFADTVPRDLYDGLQTRYDALLEKYHSLRQTGQAPVAPLRMQLPKEDGGSAKLREMEHTMHSVQSPRVKAIAENLLKEKPELSAEGALAEAVRLDNIARGRSMPQGAGDVPLPPSR